MKTQQQELQETFNYCPISGTFTYKMQKGKAKIGDVAGSYHESGAIYIRFQGKKHLAHRLAWLYMYGQLPKGEIDHKDQDRSNNAINNLRDVSHDLNMKNKPKYQNNSTGVAGVSIDKRCGKYRAYLSINGKPKGLGYYLTLEEAKAAREKALREQEDYYDNHGQ